MIDIRRGKDRGHFDHGWLDTYHTFSFADYRDPRFMGFRSLRVINEDRVAPGQGFGMHDHRDMEILTYVLAGELEHRDNMGNGEVIRPGEVQYMAAGTGIEHSEFNPSKSEAVHLMQIWIRPDRKSATPHYEQREFPALSKAGGLTLLASPDGRDGSIRLNQDARMLAARLGAGQTAEYQLEEDRGAWVQVLRGKLRIDGQELVAGDGAAIENERRISIQSDGESELMLFDLA